MTREIDPARLDRALLARSIFESTNKVRRELGLKEFVSSPQADAAAEIQASISAFRRVLTHENPLARLKTPMDRARHSGMKPTVVAENVAVTPLYDVGASTEVGILRTKDGTSVYVHPETQERLRTHTYASFGENVVARWMESPSHHANIVNPKYRTLGCAVWPSKGASGADVFYSAQLFATP